MLLMVLCLFLLSCIQIQICLNSRERYFAIAQAVTTKMSPSKTNRKAIVTPCATKGVRKITSYFTKQKLCETERNVNASNTSRSNQVASSFDNMQTTHAQSDTHDNDKNFCIDKCKDGVWPGNNNAIISNNCDGDTSIEGNKKRKADILDSITDNELKFIEFKEEDTNNDDERLIG